jgi:hypothetical protein
MRIKTARVDLLSPASDKYNWAAWDLSQWDEQKQQWTGTLVGYGASESEAIADLEKQLGVSI